MLGFIESLDREIKPPARPNGTVAIDLFSGAGGLTLGLKAAGVRTVAAVEVEPYRISTYLGHSPNVTMLAADVRSVDFTA